MCWGVDLNAERNGSEINKSLPDICGVFFTVRTELSNTPFFIGGRLFSVVKIMLEFSILRLVGIPTVATLVAQ